MLNQVLTYQKTTKMICNTAGQSTEPIEQVNVSINAIAKVLIREELTIENQSIYDDYVNQFMINITTCIENYSDSVDSARFSDVLIDEETISFDYNTLTTLEKAKVDNFISLVNSI